MLLPQHLNRWWSAHRSLQSRQGDADDVHSELVSSNEKLGVKDR